MIDSLDIAIEGLDKPDPPGPPHPLGPPGPPSPGEKFAILAREEETKNMYDNIGYLNNKLKDNNLTLAKYKKISDDIDQIKKYIAEKEQELYEVKKDLEKRIRTDQVRSFKDHNK